MSSVLRAAPPAVRPGVRGIVRHHPLASFFVLAFGVSWLAWLPYVLSTSGLGLLPLRIPALLGTTQILGVLPGAYLGPVTAAFVVTATAEGRSGLRHWARRLVHWRVGWRWYAAVLAGVPAAVLLATWALPDAWGHVATPTLVVLAAYLPVLVLQFLTTAVAEEPGWRDFALPRLQHRHGPVLGTVVLGTLWGGWHLPLFLTQWGGWPHVSWVSPVEFVACCIPLSIVMTWVFNRSGQSLPLVMVLHASINTVYSSIWTVVFPTLDPTRDTLHAQLLASLAAAAVLVVVTRGRLGLSTAPNHHGTPVRAPAPSPISSQHRARESGSEESPGIRPTSPDGSGRHPAPCEPRSAGRRTTDDGRRTATVRR